MIIIKQSLRVFSINDAELLLCKCEHRSCACDDETLRVSKVGRRSPSQFLIPNEMKDRVPVVVSLTPGSITNHRGQ
jgi:hypothetical protein